MIAISGAVTGFLMVVAFVYGVFIGSQGGSDVAIQNGKNTPIDVQTGTVPNVGDALGNWGQPITVGVVTKTNVGYQAVEDMIQVMFRGVVQPLSDRKLQLKPEGQRSRTWLQIHADPSLVLENDDVVVYQGRQYRVMASYPDYKIYGYVEYHVIEDWTGAGPETVAP